MSRLPLALLALSVAGCTTVAPAPTSPLPAAPAAPRLEIQWTRTSGEHDAVFEQTYRAAGERLRMGLDTLRGTDWGVILDADETVLDNSLYQRERAAVGQGYSPETWAAWVERREAAALPGAVAFTRLVRDLGAPRPAARRRAQT